MSYLIQSVVGFSKEEYDALEVKYDNTVYIVDEGDRLRCYLGDHLVDSLEFSDFTESQKDQIRSWAQQEAEAWADAAHNDAQWANESAQHASDYAEQAHSYMMDASLASEYASRAHASEAAATEASANASRAAQNATSMRYIAQSYARGETGRRDDEATDNARYYMEQAREAAQEAKNFATITPPACEDISVERLTNSVVINWRDPSPLIINGWKVSDYQRTLVVFKVGSMPTGPDDGTIIAATSTEPSNDHYALPSGVTFRPRNYYDTVPLSYQTADVLSGNIKFFSYATNGNVNNLPENESPAPSNTL